MFFRRGNPYEERLEALKLFAENRLDAVRDELRSVSSKIEALESRLDGLETAPKLLRTEWEDTLDRLNRIMGRLNARLKRAESDEQPPQGTTPAPDPMLGHHGLLERARRRRG